MRRAAALLLLLPFAACGGGGGGTTTPTASAALVDGASGGAISGAAGSARPGDSVTVERTGYIRRDTIVPRDNVISLWPSTVNEAYVRTLVYSRRPCATGSCAGQGRPSPSRATCPPRSRSWSARG
jgi:hypothetical protein